MLPFVCLDNSVFNMRRFYLIFLKFGYIIMFQMELAFTNITFVLF